MKIIDLTQGTKAWHDWRSYGIGASDVPVLLRSNPYKTVHRLWEIKCGFSEDDAPNRAMYHGMQYEEAARRWVNDHYDFKLEPLCVEDDTRDYFKASLDGYDIEKKTLVEIKCPLNEQTIDDAKLRGQIHTYWIDQIQWQIMLTGAKEAYCAVFDFRDGSCHLVAVYPDSGRILKMIDHAEDFWTKVTHGIEPPLDIRDYKVIYNDRLSSLLKEYHIEDQKEKKAKIRKDEIKREIIEYGDGANFMCDGHKVYQQANPMGYDYKKMKDDGIDLEKYKKEQTKSFRISTRKDNVLKIDF